MLSDVSGILVGHQTNEAAMTGCTVVVFPPGTVASGEVRGGAPATREFALLDPGNLVQNVDAVVLSGGSAFGLATSDGVMAWLEEHGRGFPTKGGLVPIVVGLSLYDLTTGDGSVRPGAAQGRAAATVAATGAHAVGLVGAGTGATTSKWLGPDAIRPGGVGTATCRDGALVVSALIAVNAYGCIDGDIEGDLGPPVYPPKTDAENGVTADGAVAGSPVASGAMADGGFANTTIGVVVTNAVLDKSQCYRVAKVAHGGMARALLPAHTPFDGDALVVGATGQVEADALYVQLLAQRAVEQAIRSVRAETSL